MNILLTNDDGFDSQGIRLLKKHLSKYGRVVIFAPDSPQSAKSVSISINVPLVYEEVEKDVFKFSGTPADCVSFALSMLNLDFDLVVSGCNHGINVSYDTLYSGTCGACSEALVFHKKAVAFSAEHNFDLVDKHFDEVFDYIIEKDLLSDQYFLNVNFPIGDEFLGIKLSSLYYRHDEYYFSKSEDGYRAYRYMQKYFNDDLESDMFLVNHGFVSICPMNKTLYSENILQELKKKI